jgi:hypothetical protein
MPKDPGAALLLLLDQLLQTEGREKLGVAGQMWVLFPLLKFFPITWGTIGISDDLTLKLHFLIIANVQNLR